MLLLYIISHHERRTTLHKLRIGTLVPGNMALKVIPQILPLGFESFGLTFWETIGDINLPQLAQRLQEILEGHDVVISSLSVSNNALAEDNDKAVADWKQLIDHAHLFGTDLVTGFAGRVVNEPIEKSIPRFREVFGPLAKRAEDQGIRLAFENCSMGGNWHRGGWNIAHGPTAWEMMFDALPADNIGLEWEPCHQLVNLIDPVPQLRKWVHRIFHVHGKDATIAWDIIREYGINGPKAYAWHRTPGFGDSNWTDLITILRQSNYQGTIDIEGFHDPVYRGELEMTGQVRSLHYLKECRGGDFVPSPY
ncbi:MAG: sugar phosphate isomerase/epimerase [Limnochordia bacterium]|jgi:sugar phosphate isomerase/epimerase|nr:sugar phosphate isomerase/epimerase [Limnochordia bacterium]